MSYSLTNVLVLGPASTGLTLNMALTDTLGNLVVKDITTGFIELGVGYYMHTYSYPDGSQGAVVYYTGTIGGGSNFASVAIKAAADINPAVVQGTAIADYVLKRGSANVEDSADVRSLAEFIMAALHGSISGNTLTISKSNGSTFNTRSVGTSVGATPIVSVQ